jgi:hypothetical protein
MAKLSKCFICSEKSKLVIDHCHNNNKVRKLLCSNCNTALGLFKENIKTIKNAIKYIEDHND